MTIFNIIFNNFSSHNYSCHTVIYLRDHIFPSLIPFFASHSSLLSPSFFNHTSFFLFLSMSTHEAVLATIKSASWCFTINNPTAEEREFFSNIVTSGQLPRNINFLVFQEERGHDEGTTHFQGYLELNNKFKLGWLKNNFNSRAHYENRRGTQEEAIAYCCKEDTRVQDGLSGRIGQPRGGSDGQTREEAKKRRIETLDAIRKNQVRLRDVESELLLNTGFLQASKFLLSTKLGPRRTVEVITIIGATGIGKSYAAYKYGGDEIITYQRNGWFGGADTQGDVLLFDEFTGNLPLSELLKLLDGYPNQLPVKGSFYPAHYTKVFITSNVMPEHWWKKNDDEINQKREGELDCLYRRIGYPGPDNSHPEYANGHFIVIPEIGPTGARLSVLSQRAKLQMDLLMIGIDIRDNASPEPSDDENDGND